MTDTDFKFQSRFLNNSVFIIDAIPPGEQQTGIHLHSELADLRDYHDVTIRLEHRKVSNSGEFLEALAYVADASRNGAMPIIHIESHASAKIGLTIGPTENAIGWSTLEKELRRINVACGENLGVVISACEGYHAIAPIKLNRTAPFYFLLGTQNLITPERLSAEMPRFYRDFFRGMSLDAAVQGAKSFRLFHAEKFLLVTFMKYLKRHCMGRGREDRVENLLTQLRVEGKVTNRATRRAARKELKSRSRVEDQEGALDRYYKIFLPKRPRSFTWSELVTWLRQGQ